MSRKVKVQCKTPGCRRFLGSIHEIGEEEIGRDTCLLCGQPMAVVSNMWQQVSSGSVSHNIAVIGLPAVTAEICRLIKSAFPNLETGEDHSSVTTSQPLPALVVIVDDGTGRFRQTVRTCIAAGIKTGYVGNGELIAAADFHHLPNPPADNLIYLIRQCLDR